MASTSIDLITIRRWIMINSTFDGKKLKLKIQVGNVSVPTDPCLDDIKRNLHRDILLLPSRGSIWVILLDF